MVVMVTAQVFKTAKRPPQPKPASAPQATSPEQAIVDPPNPAADQQSTPTAQSIDTPSHPVDPAQPGDGDLAKPY